MSARSHHIPVQDRLSRTVPYQDPYHASQDGWAAGDRWKRSCLRRSESHSACTRGLALTGGDDGERCKAPPTVVAMGAGRGPGPAQLWVLEECDFLAVLRSGLVAAGLGVPSLADIHNRLVRPAAMVAPRRGDGDFALGMVFNLSGISRRRWRGRGWAASWRGSLPVCSRTAPVRPALVRGLTPRAGLTRPGSVHLRTRL
jgi:hypothetical protein